MFVCSETSIPVEKGCCWYCCCCRGLYGRGWLDFCLGRRKLFDEAEVSEVSEAEEPLLPGGNGLTGLVLAPLGEVPMRSEAVCHGCLCHNASMSSNDFALPGGKLWPSNGSLGRTRSDVEAEGGMLWELVLLDPGELYAGGVRSVPVNGVEPLE